MRSRFLISTARDSRAETTKATLLTAKSGMLALYYFFITVGFVHCCPDIVKKICYCEEVQNGIVLDCSNSTGSDSMEIIRKNQGLLGLIQSLKMNSAELNELPSNFFSGLYIKKIDFSKNAIKKIDSKAFDGMYPVVEELVLSHNLIEQIPTEAFTSLPNLVRLDLSNNLIAAFTEIMTFPNLNKLFDVDLSKNQISAVHTNTFQNLKNSIRTINLGHNELITIPSSAIRGLKQLQSLHFHNNKIRQLDALSFLNLPVLNLLNLASNNIQDVNRQAFLNVPNLRFLYLSGNNIKTLTPNQFQTFEELEMLDLTNNDISEVPSNFLSGMKQLRQLYLSNNQIAKTSQNAFVNSSIVTLVLSQNNLTYIPSGMLSGLTKLQQLSLRENQISSIDRNAFYDVTSLVMLDLAKNSLTNIEPSTFFSQLNLLYVDLSHNKIEKTPYSAFNGRIGTVMLKENPLVCLEKIHMVQDGIGVYLKDTINEICNDTLKQETENSHQENVSNQIPLVPKLRIYKNSEVHPVQSLPSHIEKNDNAGSSKTTRLIITKDKYATENVMSTTEQYTMNKDFSSQVLPTRQDDILGIPKSLETSSLAANASEVSEISEGIHPFPIPFLKKRVNASESKMIGLTNGLSAQNVYPPTLPPTILIEPGSFTRSTNNFSEALAVGEKIEKFVLLTPKTNETVPIHSRKSNSTNVVVIVFVTTSMCVLLLLILSLCINRHRQLKLENPYHNSQMVDLNAAEHRYQNSMQAEVQVNQFDGPLAWNYSPGSGYCNYYK